MEHRVLTIQDISCVGQCSLTVALPIISACGIETAILPSAMLSNHTGSCFKNWTFLDLTEEFPKILAKWSKQEIKFSAFYTGYILKQQIPYVQEIFKKTSKEGTIKIIDSVMADNGKLYPGFDDTFITEMRKLVKEADYVLPNLTEAAFLLGVPSIDSGYEKEYAECLAKDLYYMGAKNVILKGLEFEKGKIGVLVYDGKDFSYYFHEKLDKTFHGTGDVFASVFTGSLLRGKTALEAATIAADFVVESIKFTMDDKKHNYGVRFEKAIAGLKEKL